MKFIFSVSIYTFAGLLSSAVPFFLLPILTRYLSPADYGVLAIFQTVLTFLFPLTVIGIGTAIYIEYFKLTKQELSRYVSSAMIVPCVSFFFNVVVFILAAGFLERNFGIPKLWAIAIPFIALLQVIPYLVRLLYQVQEEPVNYGRYQVGLTLLNFGFSIVLIIVFLMGWQGRILGLSLAFFLFTCFGLRTLLRKRLLVRDFDFGYLKGALLLGAPLIPHELGNTIINMSDRLFVSKMAGLEETGLYSIGYQLGMIFFILCASFNQAWAPYVFRLMNEGGPRDRAMLVRRTYLFSFILIVLLLPFFYSLPFIYNIFIDKTFHSSIKYVHWVAVGYVFYGFYVSVVNYIYFSKKTHLVACLTVGGAFINIVLNYFLILIFGPIGATYATALSFLVLFLAAWWISNRICPMPWFSFFRYS